MPYTNKITIENALYLDLFDDITYEWLKEVLDPKMDREELDFEVEIEDLDSTRIAYCKTKITFELRMLYDERFGEKYYKTKKFNKIIEYQGSSGFAMILGDMYQETEDEEEEEEDD